MRFEIQGAMTADCEDLLHSDASTFWNPEAVGCQENPDPG